MKTITVYVEYSAGMSHSGWMGTEATITKEVSDEVAVMLQDLIAADKPNDYRRRGATAEAVAEAIEAGHTELQTLHDELCEKFYDMGERSGFSNPITTASTNRSNQLSIKMWKADSTNRKRMMRTTRANSISMPAVAIIFVGSKAMKMTYGLSQIA